MPLIYKHNVLMLLKDKGYNSTVLRESNILGQATITNLRRSKPISWANIERICELLDCQPGDIIIFVPNDK